jgi:hypothetical protein
MFKILIYLSLWWRLLMSFWNKACKIGLLNPEDGTDMLPRNVGKTLPLLAA